MKSSQLLDLESSSSAESELVVDYGLLGGSMADSQFGSGAKLDSRPRSVTGFGPVADSNSATWLDFATMEHSWFSILRLTTGSYPWYDQSLHNTYKSTTSVGSLFDNA